MIKEIELKTFNPPVHDDPEFCVNINGKCRYFQNNCGLFVNKKGRSEYILHDENNQPQKLEECKEHYQRAKDESKN